MSLRPLLRSLALLLLLCVAFVSTAYGEKTLRFTFAGDCTIGGEDRSRDEPTSFDSFIAAQGYDYPFSKVKHIFEEDDLTVVNFEGVFYDYTRNKVEKTYNFRGPTTHVEILKRAGIEAVNLANNHTLDYGIYGCRRTKATLSEAGIHYFDQEEPYLFEKDGITVAFVSLPNEGFYAMGSEFFKGFAKLREAGVDAIVCSFHFGTEYQQNHNEVQTRFAHRAIEHGADLVIGHHPHVLQGLEVVNGRTICYSLGNFCFGGNKAVRALETMLVSVEFTFTDDGDYLGQQLTLHPAHVSGDPEKNDYCPRLVTGDDAHHVIDLIQQDTDFVLAPYVEGIGAVQAYLPAD